MFDLQVSYDPETNIAIHKLIGKPESEQEVKDHYMKVVENMQKGGESMVWSINDLTELKLGNVKLVKLYNRLILPHKKKHIFDYVVVCNNPLQKVATMLYNTFSGERHPIFSKIEDAKNWIFSRQEETEKYPPKNS